MKNTKKIHNFVQQRDSAGNLIALFTTYAEDGSTIDINLTHDVLKDQLEVQKSTK